MNDIENQSDCRRKIVQKMIWLRIQENLHAIYPISNERIESRFFINVETNHFLLFTNI